MLFCIFFVDGNQMMIKSGDRTRTVFSIVPVKGSEAWKDSDQSGNTWPGSINRWFVRLEASFDTNRRQCEIHTINHEHAKVEINIKCHRGGYTLWLVNDKTYIFMFNHLISVVLQRVITVIRENYDDFHILIQSRTLFFIFAYKSKKCILCNSIEDEQQ